MDSIDPLVRLHGLVSHLANCFRGGDLNGVDLLIIQEVFLKADGVMAEAKRHNLSSFRVAPTGLRFCRAYDESLHLFECPTTSGVALCKVFLPIDMKSSLYSDYTEPLCEVCLPYLTEVKE